MAKLRLEELEAGARIEVDENKESPYDFVLWFTKSKFEDQAMKWDSPWGTGYPGWHIECSAMSVKYLGEQFDIHCGGIDHIQVHHTNEIAQTEAATGKSPWVKYWMHGEFLVLKDAEKMAKSGENFITLQTLIDKGYDPLVYRMFCFSSHYRSKLNFSWEALDGAKNTFENFKNKVIDLKEDLTEPADEASDKIEDYSIQFDKAINDDLDMPIALAVVWAVIKDNEIGNQEKYDLLLSFDKILGFGIDKFEKGSIDADVESMIQKREEARKAKNFKEADKIRDELKLKGIILEDSKEGIKWKKA